jgi:DNA-binding CsgD family transcriptional regulator
MHPRSGVLLALDIAATAAECRTVGDLRVHLLPALAAAAGADIAIYHQAQLAPGRGLEECGLPWPHDDSFADVLVPYPEVMHESPLIRHFARHPGPGVVSVSELMPRRAWKENAVYRESHRHFGIDDQVALVFSLNDGNGHAVTLGRSGRAFGRRERDLLRMVQPHVRAAVRRGLESPEPYRVVHTRPGRPVRWTARSGPAIVAPAAPSLTARQLEVLALVAAGLSNQQIGRRLDLAPRTVDKHLENAFGRLGAHSRVEAMVTLREHMAGVL